MVVMLSLPKSAEVRCHERSIAQCREENAPEESALERQSRESPSAANCPDRLVSHDAVGGHFLLYRFANSNEPFGNPFGCVPVPVVGSPPALVAILEN
mgnify:CR=1 FL=1